MLFSFLLSFYLLAYLYLGLKCKKKKKKIRNDIVDVVRRLNARLSPSGDTIFTGWARMAVPITEFS